MKRYIYTYEITLKSLLQRIDPLISLGLDQLYTPVVLGQNNNLTPKITEKMININ